MTLEINDLTGSTPIVSDETDIDAPTEIKIPLETNNSITIYKDEYDPFWRIKYEKGQIPNQLSGAFTSKAKAEEAIRFYLAKKFK